MILEYINEFLHAQLRAPGGKNKTRCYDFPQNRWIKYDSKQLEPKAAPTRWVKALDQNAEVSCHLLF